MRSPFPPTNVCTKRKERGVNGLVSKRAPGNGVAASKVNGGRLTRRLVGPTNDQCHEANRWVDLAILHFHKLHLHHMPVWAFGTQNLIIRGPRISRGKAVYTRGIQHHTYCQTHYVAYMYVVCIILTGCVC